AQSGRRRVRLWPYLVHLVPCLARVQLVGARAVRGTPASPICPAASRRCQQARLQPAHRTHLLRPRGRAPWTRRPCRAAAAAQLRDLPQPRPDGVAARLLFVAPPPPPTRAPRAPRADG